MINIFKFGHGEWATGIISRIEPNEKGGLAIRIKVRQSDGGFHQVFLDLYGRTKESFEKENYEVGTKVVAVWEKVQKRKTNRETGKYDGFIMFNNNIEFAVPFNWELTNPAGRTTQQPSPQQQMQAPNPPVNDDEEEW